MTCVLIVAIYYYTVKNKYSRNSVFGISITTPGASVEPYTSDSQIVFEYIQDLLSS